MAYKLTFPLDEFKKMNSMLTEYYSEYFIDDKSGLIMGTSLNEYAFNIATISPELLSKLSLGSVLLHPNYMRKQVGDLKKTMTYVYNDNDVFRVYEFEDKIKDIPDMAKGKLVVSLIHHEENSMDANAIHMRDIANRIKPYGEYLNQRLEFEDIPRPYYMSQFIADDILSLEDNDGGHLIVTRQMFPKYQRVDGISWASVNLDDEFRLGIFETKHPILTMYTFVKYLRGI